MWIFYTTKSVLMRYHIKTDQRGLSSIIRQKGYRFIERKIDLLLVNRGLAPAREKAKR